MGVLTFFVPVQSLGNEGCSAVYISQLGSQVFERHHQTDRLVKNNVRLPVIEATRKTFHLNP